MTGDNAPQDAGWQLPPRCCGTWVDGLVCGICSNYVTPGPNVVLSDN